MVETCLKLTLNGTEIELQYPGNHDECPSEDRAEIAKQILDPYRIRPPVSLLKWKAAIRRLTNNKCVDVMCEWCLGSPQKFPRLSSRHLSVHNRESHILPSEYFSPLFWSTISFKFLPISSSSNGCLNWRKVLVHCSGSTISFKSLSKFLSILFELFEIHFNVAN